MPPSSPPRVAGLIAVAVLASAAVEAAPGQRGSSSIGLAPGLLFVPEEWDHRMLCVGLSASHAVLDRLSFVIVPSLVFFEGGTLIVVPIGVQLDVGSGLVPRLSLLARATAGPAFVIASGAGAMAIFDVGVKYHLEGGAFVGVEPLSVPVFLGSDPFLIFKPAVIAGLSF